MDRNEVIALARKAGAIVMHGNTKEKVLVGNDAIERFAALVEERAVEREMEACAKVCDELVVTDGLHQAKYCANAIRARGEK